MNIIGNPKNRVLQLDGYLLDDQILEIIKTQLTDAFSDSSLPLKIQRIGSRHNKDLLFLFKLLLYKLFIWDKSTTYGLLLQNLKLSNNNNNNTNINNQLNNIGKLVILLNIISTYSIEKITSFLYSNDFNQLENSNPKLYLIFSKLINFLPLINNSSLLLEIFNKILFFIFGDYTTLYYRIFKIKHEILNQIGTSFASNPQSISYEFQDRQLIWNSFTEFINNISDIKMPKIITNIWNRTLIKVIKKDNEILKIDNDSMFRFLPERCCAICYLNDINQDKNIDDNLITNPYITNCNHIYCYFCLMNVMNNKFDDLNDDSDNIYKWNCLRCNEKVLWCQIYSNGMDDLNLRTNQYFESEKYLSRANNEDDDENNEGDEYDDDNTDNEEEEEEEESYQSSENNSSDNSMSETDSAYEYDEEESS